jgi:DNA-binding GntR family transcriptional regulator
LTMIPPLRVSMDRPPSLRNAAVTALTEAILRGELRPGQRLIETELSTSLGISRAPLREALRSLSKEGLIRIEPNRGAFVASPSPDEILHLALFRALVQGAAAKLVATYRENKTLDQLEAALTRQHEASGDEDWGAFLNAHWDFHMGICIGSRNSYLAQALLPAANALRLYHQLTGVNQERMLTNNRIYLDALRGSDPGIVEELLRSQIIRVAYETLDIAIPAALQSYITMHIDTSGQVRTGPPPVRVERTAS